MTDLAQHAQSQPKQKDNVTPRHYRVNAAGGFYKGVLYKDGDVLVCTEADASKTWTEVKPGEKGAEAAAPADTDPRTMSGAQKHR
jgi:hypothetical protein